MTRSEIQSWLVYWRGANMVELDQINAFDQVQLARKYCPCLRRGPFSPGLVSDLQIWRALVALRKNEAVGLSWERADG